VNRKFLLLALLAAGACTKAAPRVNNVQTAVVQRRDIVVQAEATGVIEPINVIEVKSKTASGQVIEMPIEVGSYVRPGDLIVQIDTTQLHIDFMQSLADSAASQANYNVVRTQLERQSQLFEQRIITKQELETAQNAEVNARASLQRAATSVATLRQRLVDSRVSAAVEGTIITKPVSKGQVIQAGGQSVSGGSVIATMADLTKVRARALVNETEIGQVHEGQGATVLVDAYPERAFNGEVLKVEPIAVVQQNVTMFPVLISLENEEGLLKPGMNGEVQILTDRRDNVVAVPNDAIRPTRECQQSAVYLGINADSATAKCPGAGGRGGAGRNANALGGGNGRGTQGNVSRGELDPTAFGFAFPQDPQGGRQGRGLQMVQVTDADCKRVNDVLRKNAAVAKQIDDLRAKMAAARGGGGERGAAAGERRGGANPRMQEMQKLYEQLGLDSRIAGACRRRSDADASGSAGGQRGTGLQAGSAAAPAAAGLTMGGAFTPQSGGRGGFSSGTRRVDPNATPRSGVVFVQKGTTWEPRVLRLGIANYDFTEVVSGVEEGERVALMTAVIMQARRQEQMDRQKAAATASPLGGGMPGGGPGGGRGRGF
jgi:HlyD family secretion protein